MPVHNEDISAIFVKLSICSIPSARLPTQEVALVSIKPDERGTLGFANLLLVSVRYGRLA